MLKKLVTLIIFIAPIYCTASEPQLEKWTSTKQWASTKQWGESSLKPSFPTKQAFKKTTCPRYCDSINQYSKTFGVPPKLVISLIHAESNFNRNAVSHAGAKGLMQLMDFNWEPWGIDPFNADDNIRVGTAMLARLLKKYRNPRLALAAYNAGEGAVKKYGGVPPYQETIEYIARIETLLNRF